MPHSANPLAVALYQSDCRNVSPRHQLDRLRDHLFSGAAEHYDVVVCPELYLSGYLASDAFHDYAEPVGGPFMRKVQELAASARCAIVYGFPERTENGMHNACAFVDTNGQLAAVHRKSVFPHEYEQRYFTPGTAPTIVECCGWKIGILICYEAEFPECTRYCAVRGCDLVVVPTALSIDFSIVTHRLIPTRAFENNIFVAYANYCGKAGSIEFAGESVIVDPYGEALARAGREERVISAVMERERIARTRQRLHFLADLDNLRTSA